MVQLVHPGRMMSPFIGTGHHMPIGHANHYAGWDFSGRYSTITVTGSGVSAITDASGNSRDGTQTTDSARPPYGSRVVNGLLVGNLENDQVQVPQSVYELLDGPPYTVFCVALFDSVGVNFATRLSRVTGGTVSGNAMLINTGPVLQHIYPRDATIGSINHGTVPVANKIYLLESSMDASGNVSFNVNNGTAVTASNGGNNGGGAAGNIGSTTGSDGAAIETHIFNTVLSEADRVLWRNYLNRWGWN